VDPDPDHFGYLDPPKSGFASNKNQDPDPYHSDNMDPEPDPDSHQFADDKPKWMEYEPI
jgi:hypothetical protein